MLAAPATPIEDVAEAAGFASVFTFRRQFRKILGIPLREFRARFFPGKPAS